VEELEQRLKDMEDHLQRLSRGEKLPQQTIHDFQSPGLAAGPVRNPGIDHSELEGAENDIIGAQLPDDEASQAGQDTSDQPSCILRSQDGKMRYFGLPFLISLVFRS
jgi:hypothetical protein